MAFLNCFRKLGKQKAFSLKNEFYSSLCLNCAKIIIKKKLFRTNVNLPMNSSSNDTSSSHNNGLCVVLGLRIIGYVCNLPIIWKKNFRLFFISTIHIMFAVLGVHFCLSFEVQFDLHTFSSLAHSGETRRKFESVYSGGTMDSPDSGKVFQYWHCCGSEDPFDPGCTAAPHSSYDD